MARGRGKDQWKKKSTKKIGKRFLVVQPLKNGNKLNEQRTPTVTFK